MKGVGVSAQDIGAKVRELRKNYGLTQRQLAELAELSDKTIRDIEVGTATPSLGNVLRVLGILGLSIEVA